ncbi:MAG: hypothetical protein PUP90_08855 [Nostoc sp. S4]|nr:hypothetical protein [Nostoc sp. S4]
MELDDARVKIVCAEVSFAGERTVRGGDVTVEALWRSLITSTSSMIPDIPGLAGTPYLINRNFTG